METYEKPKISKVDKYEIRLGCTVWSAKTEKDAKKIAERLEKEQKEKFAEKNSLEAQRQKRLNHIEHNLDNYVEYLKKELWHLQRDKGVAQEHKNQVKEIIKVLTGIMTMKMRVSWHQSYFDSSTSYSIDAVKEDQK